MNLGIKWLWKDTSKESVKDLKNKVDNLAKTTAKTNIANTFTQPQTIHEANIGGLKIEGKRINYSETTGPLINLTSYNGQNEVVIGNRLSSNSYSNIFTFNLNRRIIEGGLIPATDFTNGSDIVNKNYVDNKLAYKADTTYVNNQLNGKADTTTVNNISTELANKADTTYVNSKLPVFINEQVALNHGEERDFRITQNARPIIVFDNNHRVHNDWSYNPAAELLTIRNRTGATLTFTYTILELK